VASRRLALINGEVVRSELDHLGLSQKQFAELVGTREATISQVINGVGVSPEMTFRIAFNLKRARPRR